MEMESNTRRSLDRLRELGQLKKAPRLSEDQRDPRAVPSNGASRAFPPRAPASSALVSVTGNAVSRVPVAVPQQNHAELVTQYKLALAELTFNSKPIITNLTIIAGENLHAAKWIAASVCTNILEVPSDQKLPSLYLLDSIVKNIGRDYIKYFAARLPDVFVKAYRQVDPSLHAGMRHLFGTWRTVFPPSCLQSIADDLGIPSPINGSSSASAASRSVAQSQRPPQSSIHVNPKVIEARERLQQSSRAISLSDNTVSTVGILKKTEVPSRTALIGSEKSWTDLPVKLRDPRLLRKDISNEPIPEKHPSVEYGDYDSSSEFSNHSDLGTRKLTERVTGRGGVNLDPRKFQAPVRSAQADPQRQPPLAIGSSNNNKDQNWKNSEEEEYMWDDMKFRSKDHGGSESSKKDVWTPDNSENADVEAHHRQCHGQYDVGLQFNREGSSDSLRVQPAIGKRPLSSWPSQDQDSLDVSKCLAIALKNLGGLEGYNASVSSLPPNTAATGRRGVQTGTSQSVSGTQDLASLLKSVLGSSGILEQKRQRDFDDLVEQEHVVQTQSTAPAQNFDSFTLKPQNHINPSILQNLLSSQALSFQNIVTSSQAMHHPNLARHKSIYQPHSELSQSKPPGNTVQTLPQSSNSGITTVTGCSNSDPSIHSSADVSGQPSTTALLAAIDKSGLLSSDSATTSGLTKMNINDLGALMSNLKNLTPLPIRPPIHPQTMTTAMTVPVVRPPVPNTSTTKIPSTATTSEPNALASILGKLVAEGVISSPAKAGPIVNSCIPASSNPSSAAVPTVSSYKTKLLSEYVIKGKTALSSPVKTETKRELKDLIGTKFKPEILREVHPSVITSLIEDLPHQCSICGLRVELEDQLNDHLEWHSSHEISRESLISRKWNVSLDEWITGSGGSPCTGEDSSITIKEERGVVADEDQCICMLCGEPFKDFYSIKKDRWMYKGAVYMLLSPVDGELGTTVESAATGPIVHADCLTPTSLCDLGISQNVKMEPTDS